MYFWEVAKLHAIPKSMISNRDTKLLNNFQLNLWTKIGTWLKFIVTYHPQTDRQTEERNMTLGTLFRAFAMKNIKG